MINVMPFNPRDWYWRVLDKPEDQVWSSARAHASEKFSSGYVSVTDDEYKKWVADGYETSVNTTEEIMRATVVEILPDYIADMIPVPMAVSPRQARLALAQIGLLKQVNAHINSLPEDDVTRIAWEFSNEVRRDDPGVIAMARAFHIEDQLPALFAVAVKL